MGFGFKGGAVVFLLPDKLMQERGLTAESLTYYIKAVETLANSVLESLSNRQGVSGSLVLGVKPPSRSRLWVSMESVELDIEFLSLLKAGIEEIPAPRVFAPVAFAINFEAWGGSAEEKPLIPLSPREWTDAVKKMGRSEMEVPDEIFEVVWLD